MRSKCVALAMILALSLAGCTTGTPANKSSGEGKKSEEEIRQAFGALQSAIKARDADKIWGLLAKDSQDDAEHVAKTAKSLFGTLADKEKTAFEKKNGLSAKEIMDITGKLYVKSSSFFSGEVAELPDSKLDKVVVTGESGTVHYTEEKGEKEKLPVSREQGQWKFAVPVPQVVLK